MWVTFGAPEAGIVPAELAVELAARTLRFAIAVTLAADPTKVTVFVPSATVVPVLGSVAVNVIVLTPAVPSDVT